MAPKKPKDTTLDENYWRTCIEDAPLNEEIWNVKVILIEAAGSDQDRIYLNKFEIFAAEERRFVIKNICKTETIFMVNQLGGEKKVKDDNLRVFEEGQAFLKDKKEIPPDILALIIKYLILKMKDEYLFIKHQKLEVREGMRKESATMINRAEVRGTVNVKPPEEEQVQPVQPSKDKNKKDQSEPVQEAPELTEGKKYNTLLRVRGEEWRDKIYVDDFPLDGPNLYVAITGFVEPFLAGCLIHIGIPLTAIIQIRIDPTTIKVPSSLFRTTKRGQSQTEILAAKSQKFWDDLQQLRISNNTCDDYKNTAFIIFSPPYWETESLSGSPENIYDEMCYLMYDIQDLTRQHSHYLDNMDVINIPQETTNIQSQNIYNQHMAELPLECVTIYSILDSVLQAVCSSQQMEENSSKTSLSTALTLNQTRQSFKDEDKYQKAETLVKDVFKTLCSSDSTKKKYRVTYGEEYENHRDPIVINFGDLAKYKIFHLGNINMNNIIGSMLYGIPIFKLWQNQNRQSGELEAKINFHVNVLLSCFERKDVETVELNRLIHILACRKMYNNRSSLKVRHLPPSTLSEFKKVYLKRTVLAEPLPAYSSLYRSWSSISTPFASLVKNEKSNDDDESSENCRIKFLFDCPDISELVSAAEIASDKPISHMIDDFEFFEEHSGTSAFQTMVNAFNSFNCVDYKYCEVTDCLILMFFNSHDKDGVAREEWRCHLPTPLCLQDFFDFVLEEDYDWIKKEEDLYTENTVQRIQSEYKNCYDIYDEKTCLENTEISMDLLMEGSLKYEEIANVEEATPETTENKIKTTTMSPSTVTTDMASKSSKKMKSPIFASKNFKPSLIDAVSSSTIEIPRKPFSGYNLSDRRVEIFGKDSCFYSKDGTNVLTKYTIMIPGNAENIILKVAPGNDNIEFWMHKALGEVEPHIVDTCESFRISSKNNLIIYVKKQSYMVPLPTLDLSFTRPVTEKDKAVKSSPHNNFSSSKFQIMENKSFYALNVTWPNGLITETVHEDNSATISHIKQHYITPMLNLDEDMRCISLNGDVIIFKQSGLIEILRPNGAFIKITKCEKRIVQDILLEDLPSDTSSDKSKKGKGKEKTKPSKASSKSSKNAIDDDKISDIKAPEYELFIDEFETIEADGLKQKWVNDIPVDTKKLLIRTATDYCSGEVFSRRMDGTSVLLNKDGIQIVSFPDNTRIITTFIIDETEIYPEWTDEEIEYFTLFDSDTVENGTIKSKSSSSQRSYTETYRHSNSVPSLEEVEHRDEIKPKERNDGYISVQIIFIIEHKNFATVTLNKADGNVSITSPNNVNVTLSPENNYNFVLDNATKAEFNGQDLNITYKACLRCESYTSCKVKIKYDEIPSATNFHKCWLKMEDSFNKSILVNDEGNIHVIEDTVSDEVTLEEELSNTDKTERKSRKVKSETSLGKCREVYDAKSMRFFILRRELTCSELVHRALVDMYKQNCRWQPWCSINQYDTFGDNRSILSILTPVHLTETEKWLMESQFADKPKYLTYKDLKEDTGKGFYHWMRPYGRFKPTYKKPDNVVPDRLPRAFVLRNLEQQWSDAKREKLKGAKELLTAILRYRRLMESDSDTILYVPIRDLRPEDERRIDDIIQAIASRIYEDLKYRLAEDMQKRAKPTITTKPPSRSEDLSLEGELEEIPDELAVMEEKRESVVKEVETVAEMSPNLKRYWRRRAEEYKEEQFYKYLLREGSVPPYFRNVLGGAIWWEMNNIADDAATKAERRKMKCVCEEDETSTRDVTELPDTTNQTQ